MNSKTTSIIVTTILALAILSNISAVGSVYATGNMDDEEEEEAIYELQDAVEEIQGTLGTIELNLNEGSNDIQANCPTTEEIVQEVVANITAPPTEQEPENNATEPIVCPVVPEQPEQPIQENNNVTEQGEQNQTVIPPVEPEPIQNNVTEGCEPVPEPAPVVEENETVSELVPIICPINNELLGYTNTTSGEQLPISAVNETTIPFLPPIELPPVVEEPEPVNNNQTVTATELPNCNNVTQTEQEPEQNNNTTTIVPEPEQPTQETNATTDPIEFDVNCGCFVVDKSPEEVQ